MVRARSRADVACRGQGDQRPGVTQWASAGCAGPLSFTSLPSPVLHSPDATTPCSILVVSLPYTRCRRSVPTRLVGHGQHDMLDDAAAASGLPVAPAEMALLSYGGVLGTELALHADKSAVARARARAGPFWRTRGARNQTTSRRTNGCVYRVCAGSSRSVAVRETEAESER